MKNKNILLSTLLVVILLLFSACSNEPERLSCGTHEDGSSWADSCNTCSCDNGNVLCTKKACQDTSVEDTNVLEDVFNEINFNSKLEDFEIEWLDYLNDKYPNSKLYHIKTELFNCEDCYEVSYKKDREVIKIKVLNGEKKSEKTSTDLVVDIENADVCSLFQGEWNVCPKLCPTDEEACQTQCGLPTCEFEVNKLEYKKFGEVCGGLKEGDCGFGLSCYYEDQKADYGVCKKSNF